MAPQNGRQIFRLHKLDDRTAFELMTAVRSCFDSNDHIQIVPVRGFGYPESGYGVENLKIGAYTVLEMHWNAQWSVNNRSVRVEFWRAKSHGDDTADPNYDSVSIFFEGDRGEWNKHVEKIREVLGVINSYDTPMSVVDTGDAPQVLRELILSSSATHRQMLDDLNTATAEMTKRRVELEDEAEKAEKARRKAHEEALVKLEEERNKLRLQSHMSERRSIAERIENAAVNAGSRSFKPTSARITGFAVAALALLFSLAAGLLALRGLSVYEARADGFQQITSLINQSSTPDKASLISALEATFEPLNWFLVAKSVLTGAVAVGSFTYAAAWIKRYYDEDVAVARAKERLNSDVARATWVIEAIHEVKHEAKGELPQEWVDAVTQNLFVEDHKASAADDAAMALKALLGFTANASFGPDGPRLDFSRKGTKAMSKADD